MTIKRLLIICFVLILQIVKSQTTNLHKIFADSTALYQQQQVFSDVNGFLISGECDGNVDFDNGSGLHLLNAANALFLLRLDVNGTFIWMKTVELQIDLNDHFGLRNIHFDQNGNIFVLNQYTNLTGIADSVDLDLGVGEVFLPIPVSANNLSTVVLTKLDANGNYLWHQATNTARLENVDQLKAGVDDLGNFYFSGIYNPTIGLAFGGITAPPNASIRANFLLKINPMGATQWLKTLGENALASNVFFGVSGLVVEPSGKLTLFGSVTDSIDFNPSPTSVYYIPLPTGGTFQNYGLYQLNIDAIGNFLNANYLDTASSSVQLVGMNHDVNGNIFGAGYVTYSNSNPIPFIRKSNAAGQSLWVKYFDYLNANSLQCDTAGNVYASGYHTGINKDYNPGLGVNVLSNLPNQQYSGIIVKLNRNGDFANVIQLDNKLTLENNSYGLPGICMLQVGEDKSLYVINYGAKVGNLLKIGQDTCATTLGIEVLDVQFQNCPNSGQLVVNGFGGTPPYSYNWLSLISNDSIVSLTNSGSFPLEVTDVVGCVASSTILVPSVTTNSGNDLEVSLVAQNFTPSNTSSIWLNGSNASCLPSTGNLTLVLDTMLQYLNAIPAPDQIIGDSLIWNFTNITASSPLISPIISVLTPSWAPINSRISLKALIGPLTNDTDTSNNHTNFTSHVKTTTVANEMFVSPAGKCHQGFILPTQKLTYIVRFQNTGLTTANIVSILDTLDANLNESTLSVIASSHKVHTEILPGKIVKFVYDSINLLNASTNQSLSNGYIVFEVYPESNSTIGVLLDNRARIYFDYSLPNLTNTVKNTVFVGDLAAYECELGIDEINSDLSISLYPNPTKEILTVLNNNWNNSIGQLTILDNNGRILSNQFMIDEKMSLDVSNLQAGMYYVVVQNENKKAFSRFVKE